MKKVCVKNDDQKFHSGLKKNCRRVICADILQRINDQPFFLDNVMKREVFNMIQKLNKNRCTERLQPCLG